MTPNAAVCVWCILTKIKRAINKWYLYISMDKNPLRAESGEKSSVYSLVCAEPMSLSPAWHVLQGPPAATTPAPQRGHAPQALMGFQKSLSTQQASESASYMSLILYQVLTNSMLPIYPIIYYVKQTKARTVNWESGVRRRGEWKKILLKRLLDVARFINLFPKFSCQNNIWQKRIVL